jgi:hypothetical protein
MFLLTVVLLVVVLVDTMDRLDLSYNLLVVRPVVQLIPHDGPVPFPPDAATVMFFVGKHVPL